MFISVVSDEEEEEETHKSTKTIKFSNKEERNRYLKKCPITKRGEQGLPQVCRGGHVLQVD